MAAPMQEKNDTIDVATMIGSTTMASTIVVNCYNVSIVWLQCNNIVSAAQPITDMPNTGSRTCRILENCDFYASRQKCLNIR